jgi:hypothetical protein
MIAGRLGLLGVALPALALLSLAGCGSGAAKHGPRLAQVPLVSGSQVITRVQSCDRGTSAFCAWNLVVVNPRFRTADALVRAEHRFIHKLGWTGAGADSGEENASDSPGHKLRVSYASAFGDLKGFDLGWIRRPRNFALALSRAMFDRLPAMSLMLETGTS